MPDPRVPENVLGRMLQATPSRPDVTQAERRYIVEHAIGWLEATAVTLSLAGMRLEWWVSIVPVESLMKWVAHSHLGTICARTAGCR